VRLEGDQKAIRISTVRHRRRRRGWLVGRLAAGWTLLAVGALLLSGMTSPRPLAFANTTASVFESFGNFNTSSGSSSLSASPTTAATGAGDLLVAVIRTRNITALALVSTVVDSASDIWTRGPNTSQGSGDEEIWYAASAHSLTTAQSVTVTVGGTSASSSAIAFTVLDVTGAAATAPLDAVATKAASSGTSATTGITPVTTQPSEIAISDIAWNGSTPTFSQQTPGYTPLPTQAATVTNNKTGEFGAWDLLSATGAQSYSATLSASSAWAGAIATFKTGTAPIPTIGSFNPTSGPVGTPVTIIGTGFTGATAVKFFNGVSATFSVTDDQHISTSVPTGAATGVITVTTPGGTATSTTNFTVTTAPMPTLGSFTPTSGPVGTPVTITGTGFTGATAVKFFNAVSATFSVTDDQHISTSVPTGAATGVIKVTTPGGTATSTTNFTVTTAPIPTIGSFTPTSGPVGTPVTITGTGFTGATAVKFFNGVSATFSVTDDLHISTSVPTGAATGVIKVTTPGGTATSSTNFTVTVPSHPPHIMLIIDENKDYTAANLAAGNKRYILNNTQAPYLNQLMTQYASATNWYSLAHPSYKNYLGTISGATLGGIPHTASTLPDQLNAAGIPWAAYMEGLNFPGAPSSCDPNPADQQVYDDVSPYYYEWDHNPYWYFTNITSSSECNNVVPYPGSTGLLSTLDGPNPPDFVQISPNGCNDGHDDICQYSETEEADLWFQGATNLEGVTPTLTCPTYCLNLPAILSSSWYQSGGIIIITWDEAPSTDTTGGGLPNTTGGQIPTIVISANSHGAFTPAGNDYGILRAIEEQYGFTLLGNAAIPANGDLSGAFNNAGVTGSISGTVKDSVTGAAISGASVTCTGTPACTGTTTAADGTYTLNNLAPGTYTVQVTAANYAPQSIPDTVTTGAAPADNFNLVANTGTITGTVTDSVTHADLSGAGVSCTGTPTCPGTTTIANGAYSLDGLTEGTYQVTVSQPNYASQTIGVTVGPGGTPSQNFALVPNQGSITGQVTDSSTTHPIQNASVTCTGAPACTPTSTDINGNYTLTGLTEGTYQVTVSDPGYATSSLPISVTPGANLTGENFALPPATGSITGTVSDSLFPANPVVSATVTCLSTPTCTGTTTASNGTYTLSNLVPGTYTVQVVASGYATQSKSVGVTTVAAPLNFSMVPNPGSITGTVTDSVTHLPISGANVTCTGPSSCGPTTTAGDGTYTLSNLTEGTYQVTYAANNYASQSPNVNVGPGGTATENIQLVPNTGSISGLVSDSVSGHPISGANISCTGTPTCTGMTTGSGGTYLLSPLPEGNYSVTVSATGYKTQTIVVPVGPGGMPTQNFPMVANTASLSVVGSFGAANTGSAPGTTTLTALTSPQTGNGDLLVLTIKTRSTPSVTVTGITDNSSPANVWKRATGVVNGQADEEIWYVPNAGSITSVTVTVSGATSMAMTIADVTGASATSPLDQVAISSGTSTAPATGPTPITTQATEIVIGDIGWANTATLSGVAFNPQTTITSLLTQSSSVTNEKTSEQMAWQVVTTTHTQSLSGTLSGSFAWTGAIATFH
jgi:Carboxypeptidase regulatory-like domain/IPT/TIG domain